jgi:hypothetical protein
MKTLDLHERHWLDAYEQGIRLAEAEGLIRRHGKVKDDFYSHFSHGLDGSNTRELREVSRSIALHCYAARGQAWKCLEMGPGVGRASGELKSMRTAPTLHTVGLTEFNPFLRLRMGSIQLIEHAQNAIRNTCGALQESTARKIRGAGISLDLITLMELQHHEMVRAFDETNEPIADLQHIADFSTFETSDRYQLITEDNGPFRHSGDYLGAFTRAYGLLDEDGTLVLSPFDNPETSGFAARTLAQLQSILRPEDAVHIHSSGRANGDLIVARSKSPIRDILRSPKANQLLQALQITASTRHANKETASDAVLHSDTVS